MITVNEFSLPFRQGMSLMDALTEAGVNTEGLILVTLNGAFAGADTYRGRLLSDGDEIVTMKIVSGG